MIKNNTKKLCILGLMSALAIILSYIESFINISSTIPGIKIGLANIIIVTVLYKFSFKEAALINLVRIIVVGFLFGNLFSIMYSIAGAVVSLLIMTFAKCYSKLSVYGVSICGGVTHNLAQIILASIILRTDKIIYYFGFLFIAGIISGIVIGIVSAIICKRWKGLILND